MPNVYTRGGDKGTTALFGGTRVAKQSGQVEAYGAVDEANSSIGFARSLLSETCWMRPELRHIQERLFTVAAELASDAKGRAILGNTVDQDDIDQMERLIDKCLEITGKQRQFVIPGKDPASSALHIARTVIRRAERRVLTLAEHDDIRPELIKYINRLSDVLYSCARVQEKTVTMNEVEKIVREVVKQNWPEISGSATQGLREFNLAVATKMASAAQEKATEMGVPVVFVAVDEGGNTILLHRMEGSLLASLDIAQGKAFTAAAMRLPTADLKDLNKDDGVLPALANTNGGKIVVFGGGLPIFVDGQLRGGIGVSGGTVEEDLCIVNHALARAIEG